MAYVVSSSFAALAGVFLAGRIVSGDPNVGLLFELDAITAVAIGGVQLSGGIGSLHGTIIGAVLLALLSNGMNLANISPFIQTAIKGGILLAVVSLLAVVNPPAYYVFAALLVVLWIARPNMLNANVMGIFIRQVAPLGVLVLGQLLVMRVKSIDLSGGGIILLVNYFISSNAFPGASLTFFVVLALATGTAIGFFNGLMVGKRRVSAVVVTLAVSIVLIGLVQYLSSGKPPGDVPQIFKDIYDTKWGPAPTPVIFWFALTLLMALFLSWTVFGRYLTSVGENAEAALYSGVPVERT